MAVCGLKLKPARIYIWYDPVRRYINHGCSREENKRLLLITKKKQVSVFSDVVTSGLFALFSSSHNGMEMI